MQRWCSYSACVLGLVGATAAAQPMDGQTASAFLFQPGERVVQVSRNLGQTNRAMVEAMVPLMEQQIGGKLNYYGAIAFSPDEGFQSEASQSALNHHSVAAADAAALKACNAKRKAGTAACIVAARVLPKGFENRDFTLSTNATEAMRTTYRRASGAKALAVSPATGAYGVGSPDKALADCRSGGATDCRVTVQD